MNKVIQTGSYGLCLFSLEVLQDFVKREKIKSKKLLANFQKNPDRYLSTLKEGIWIPIVQINSIEYIIKLSGYEQPFCNEWEKKIEHGSFNIEVKDGLWITDIGHFLNFDKNELTGNEASYHTLDGETIYSGHKYDVPPGKYLVSIECFVRKELLEYPNLNYGFSFYLTKTDEFDGYNNPREDELYSFNVANMQTR